jgi:hypothetical protein
MWRRTAGLWGPLGFAAAAVAAARRQPGYSHRADHVSGLASRGEESALLMVPGFVALAAAQSVLAAPTSTLRRLTRAAAVTTFVAGVVRVSDPRCPQPGFDPGATASDLGHGAASIASFVLWTTMPVVAAREHDVPVWYRRLARAAVVPTIATFIVAGLTTRRESSAKGLAQRAFLTSVFLFQAATGLATSPGTDAPPNPLAR